MAQAGAGAGLPGGFDRAGVTASLSGGLIALMLLAPPLAAQGIGNRRTTPELSVGTMERPVIGLRAGYGNSDNILQLPPEEEPIGAQYGFAGINIAYAREHSRVRGVVSGDIEHRVYSKDVLAQDGGVHDNSENYGLMWANLQVDAVPERVSWFFDQTLGQIRTDPFRPDGVSNRGTVSITSTGPIVNLPVGRRNEVRFVARLDRRRFEEVPTLDSQNTVLSASFVRALSPTAQVGIEASRDEIDFEQNRDGYAFQNLSVWYSKNLARGSANLRLGEGRVDVLGSEAVTRLMRVGWYRDIGARSRLNLSAGREFSDAGNLYRFFGTTDGFGSVGGTRSITGNVAGAGAGRLQDVVVSDNPVERTSTEAMFNVSADRTTFTVSSRLWQDRFLESADLDNDVVYLDVRLRRSFGFSWSAEAQLSTWLRDFTLDDEEQDDRVARVALIRGFGIRSELYMDVQHRSRDGQNTALFEENIYSVFFSYTFR